VDREEGVAVFSVRERGKPNDLAVMKKLDGALFWQHDRGASKAFVSTLLFGKRKELHFAI
jgi:hypothetical protein